ncbi:hypothetical protein [Sporomusa sp.]|uniref:hypothetical protein n=1 Tax=Sporomusa sp. TaxID=2078658 RepID=UPI002C923C43|nr:hypothetical protein [Sporomusa sp.]HWR44278.1 hypothetical protein [Sporomusa sp.]
MRRPITLCKSKTVNISLHVRCRLERSVTALELTMMSVLWRSVVPTMSAPFRLSG